VESGRKAQVKLPPLWTLPSESLDRPAIGLACVGLIHPWVALQGERVAPQRIELLQSASMALLHLLSCGLAMCVLTTFGCSDQDAGRDARPGDGGEVDAPSEDAEFVDAPSMDGDDDTDSQDAEAEADTAEPAPCRSSWHGRGEPIDAPPLEWTWLEIPEARCMDGAATGVAVNPNPESSRLLIFVDGGGACFDSFTCAFFDTSRGWLGENVVEALEGHDGLAILDRDVVANPLRHFSWAYVPYCTGDVHSGVLETEDRSYVGYLNMTTYLERFVATFPEVDLVVLAGSSAGGIGATMSFEQTREAFTCATLHLINDSGPFMSDTYMRPCLQAQWRELWGFEAHLPAACDACFGEDGGGLINYAPYLAELYPDSRFGVIASERDLTVRTYLGFGYSLGCAGPWLMPASDHEAGLRELRDEILAGHDNARMFVRGGSGHPVLNDPLEETVAGGMPLGHWLAQLIEDDDDWANVGLE